MIQIKIVTGLLFLVAWVMGEAPRLWWGQAAPIRPMDAAALGLVIVASFDWIKNKRYKSYKNYNQNKKILAIGGILIGSWVLGLRLWTWGEAAAGLLYLLRILVYFWLIWRAEEIFREVKKWIPAAMAVFLVLGLGQYAFLPDMRFLLRYGWDEHYWRLVGTVLDPNYMGVMAGMIGFYFLNKSYKGYKFNKINKNIALSLSALATLVLTWSRASWMAAITAGGWWLAAGGKKIFGKFALLAILAGLGVGIWFLAPKPGGEGVNLLRISSIEQRLASWSEAVGVWKRHPWVGVGFNNYGVRSKEYGVGKENHATHSPSNSWLLILATMGIIGAIVISSLVISYWLRLDNFWKGITLMIGIHAVFNNTLFYPPVLGLVAIMRVMDSRRR